MWNFHSASLYINKQTQTKLFYRTDTIRNLFRTNLRSRLDLRALHRLRAARVREGRAQRHQQDWMWGPLSQWEQARYLHYVYFLVRRLKLSTDIFNSFICIVVKNDFGKKTKIDEAKRMPDQIMALNFIVNSLQVFLPVGHLRPPAAALLPQRGGQVLPARVLRGAAGRGLPGEPVRVTWVSL